MEVTESSIMIDAMPQTVWAVLDDLAAYPEWNPIVPRLAGRSTVGEVVTGELVIPDMPTPPLTPTITRLVAAREMRWVSSIPGDQGFTAEHIFILERNEHRTRLIHREEFDGPAAPHLAGAIRELVHPAYENFNRALKKRAEAQAATTITLHANLATSEDATATSILRCLCDTDLVEVSLSSPIAHNHLCGCSKCWKPAGALFAQTAVVASDAVSVSDIGLKLAIVDPSAAIKRHACSACGSHMLGVVDEPEHHFYGLTFVHPELAAVGTAAKPEFAGFVSSIIETGTSATSMAAVRHALSAAKIAAFDAFSPEIMDIIAYHKRKMASTSSHRSLAS